MEDILDLYEEAYNPKQPVICFDERPCQLLGEVSKPIPMKPGQPERRDYRYQRNGVCALLIAFEPLTAQRFVQVRRQRTKHDYACFMKELLTTQYPDVEGIRLVQDNLNTHSAGSFYERFAPEEARELSKKFEFHYTPKKASWLNMVEIELSAIVVECLNRHRRIGDIRILDQEVQACVKDRNKRWATVSWRFHTKDARNKLQRLYSITQN